MVFNKPRLKKIFLIIAIIFGCFYVLLTFYFFWIKSTSASYSWMQTWKKYSSLEDWNLPMYAVTDLDNDGKKDLITYTNCVFISSISSKDIPTGRRCVEPGLMQMVYGDNSKRTGQKLASKKPFSYQWLKKSYLVRTTDGVWKLYDMNGLQLRVYELNGNYIFKEIKPALKDIVDTYIYQLEHFGVAIFTGVNAS